MKGKYGLWSCPSNFANQFLGKRRRTIVAQIGSVAPLA
jgi:hypothetical protein